MSGRKPRGGYRGGGYLGGGGSELGGSQGFPSRAQQQARGDSSSRGRGQGRGSSTVEVFAPEYAATQNDAVTNSENKTLSLLKQDSSPNLPNRPGYGTQGRKVLLWANYFKFAVDSRTVLHRYSATVEASSKGGAPTGKLLGRLMQLLLEQLTLEHDVVSDFRATLVSRREIDIPADGLIITYRSEGDDDPLPDAKQYVVRLQHTGTLSMAALVDYAASANASSFFGTKQELIQALNLIVGQHPKSQDGIFSVGRNRYVSSNADIADRSSLGGGLQALRAFVFSVRAATERMLINVQLKNLAFYDSGPLDRLVHAFVTHNGTSRFALANFLKRLSVEVTHIQRSNKAGRRIPRIKNIAGLASLKDGTNLPKPPVISVYGAGPKDVQFFLQNEGQPGPSTSSAAGKKKKKKDVEKPETAGSYITVFEFFRSRYNITIRDTELPVVNVGSIETPSYLPMQVCEVRPGQVAQGKLTPAQTQQMIRFAVRRPAQNASSIVTSGLRLLGLEDRNAYLDAFSMSVTPQMITVPGRVMQPPAISYAAKSSKKPSFGSWNLGDNQLFRSANLERWTYLVISVEGRRMLWPTAQEFRACLDRFVARLKGIGVRVQQYMQGLQISIRPGDPELRIDNALQRFANNPEKRPHMVLIVMPSSDTISVYNRVKYICDVRVGLINQCVIDTKFAGANDQYFANVGLKVNLKLGGCNHSVASAELGLISGKDTMFVGIDVTHPSPGSLRTAPSIASIVSSIDEWLAQWPADIRIQPARQEMVEALDEMLQGCLRRWQKRNNSLPRNIVVYRDGVSEGQYQLVLDSELPALRKATEATYPSTDTKNRIPKLAIIIVGKRHHTRFYATEQKDGDRSGNPQSGTVVDRGVTEAANWDFFLQAHSAIQGTAKPAHYYVVYDEVFRKERLRPPLANAADAVEQLSHAMCYLFGRATKAVSVCPPAYYADLVCERARCYLTHVLAPAPPTSSAVSVSSDDVPNVAGLGDRVRIHEKIRDVMFYI